MAGRGEKRKKRKTDSINVALALGDWGWRDESADLSLVNGIKRAM